MWRVMLIVLAAAVAIVPIPAELVERHYSNGVYPAFQRTMTAASNASAFAWFDAFLAGSILLLLVLLVRRGRVLNVLALLACVWLLFVATWGLNYRRVPLKDKLAYDERRLTTESVMRTAHRAVAEMNRLHGPAHAIRPRTLDELAEALAPPMAIASQRVHVSPPVPARPKRTWLAAYFKRAGIDGMTDPFFLEVLLLPALVDVEQPAALAHEWGHLAGFADESDASFFAFLTCLAGDAAAQYSGWLALYPHLLGALPPAARQTVHVSLGPGPRSDLLRIAARLEDVDSRIRSPANAAYDKFLKANRIAEGIESYDEVVQLVVGTTLGEHARSTEERDKGRLER